MIQILMTQILMTQILMTQKLFCKPAIGFNDDFYDDFQFLTNTHSQVVLIDKYGDNKMTYDLDKIKNPQSFALFQKQNYYCAELYLERVSKHSLYDDNDREVLKLIFKQDIHKNLVKLQQFLTVHYSSTHFVKTDKDEVLGHLFHVAKNPNCNLEEQQKQQLGSYLQMLIAGAILLRRRFEKIGIYYELNTQMRLNRDIAKMYKKLAGLNTNLIPFI